MQNSLRIEHMPFAAAAPLVNTAGFIAAQIRRISFEGRQVTQLYFFGDLVQADPFQSGRCAGEIFSITQLLMPIASKSGRRDKTAL